MLVARGVYGRVFWTLRPNSPLAHRFSGGGLLLLEPQHSFTHCFWPATDAYEPEVRAFLGWALRSGDTFIDCGANIGYFSVLSKSLIGKHGTLVAVEANPITYRLLVRNLEANQFGTSVHCAITGTTGEVEIFVPEAGDVYSSLRPSALVSGENAQRLSVPGRPLDAIAAELKLERIDVIKIDVEGAELDVLRSAAGCLDRFRPWVIMEYGANTWSTFGADRRQLFELAQKHGFRVCVFDPPRRQLVTPSEALWSQGYANLVLEPLDRA